MKSQNNGDGTLRPDAQKVNQKKSTVRFSARPSKQEVRPVSQAELDRVEAINRAFRALKGGA